VGKKFKMKFRKELINEMCLLIGGGLTNIEVAQYMGISESTFYQWQQTYPEFSESLKKAKIKRKLTLLDVVFKASEKSWQAAAW
jgi:transposase